MNDLNSIKIRGLFNKYDVTLPISDGKLIIVGPNGYGKSTILEAITRTFKCQWTRLRTMPIESISLICKNRSINIDLSTIPTYLEYTKKDKYLRRLAASERSNILDTDKDIAIRAQELSSRLRISPSRARWIVDDISSKQHQLPITDEFSGFRELEVQLKNRIYYLPTYRRIEKQFSDVFEPLDSEPEYSRRMPPSSAFEHIYFGMQDVEEIFKRSLQEARSDSNMRLGALTGRHLSDMINNRTGDIRGFIRRHSVDQISAYLGRVESKTLDSRDKKILIEKFSHFKQNEKMRYTKGDKYIIHYLILITETIDYIMSDIERINDFVNVINHYFMPQKKCIFDDILFEIRIETTNSDCEVIKLQDLSSGEKQIFSLFSHLLLADKRSFSLFFDEPEISIAVPWQKSILPDISKTKMCDLMICVTHSPFIWDNELEKYAIDIRQHMNVR